VMDGFEVAEAVRANPAWAGIPILLLSSGAIRGDSQRCRDLGITGYFSKPVGEDELLSALQVLLGSASASVEKELVTRHSLSEAQRRLHILLVEDNRINQKLAIALLEKWGHQATLAENGQLALDQLAHTKFDLVLMDMQMPVMGGLEATRNIRARESAAGLPRIPIIAMTANAMEGDREACLAAGMDDYLAKPIKAADLAGCLAKWSDGMSLSGVVEPGFNFERAMAAMDPEIIEILVPAFLEHYRKDVDAIRQGVVTGDLETVMRNAHALRGTLAALGAEPARRRAAEIESAAKSGESASLASLIEEFEHELGALVSYLESRSN